jgi:hypothetical protein
MSQRLINSYLAEIDRLRQFSGTSTEQVIREAFKDLLKNWAKAETLVFIPELLYETNLGTKVYPHGTILHDVRVSLGCQWRSVMAFLGNFLAQSPTRLTGLQTRDRTSS